MLQSMSNYIPLGIAFILFIGLFVLAAMISIKGAKYLLLESNARGIIVLPYIIFAYIAIMICCNYTDLSGCYSYLKDGIGFLLITIFIMLALLCNYPEGLSSVIKLKCKNKKKISKAKMEIEMRRKFK